PWPKAEEARAALAALVLDLPVRLRYGGERVDRHGRALGQLFVDAAAGAWVQRDMLARGLARGTSFPDHRAWLAALVEAEGRARAMRLGIWGDPYYMVRRADRPAALIERTGQYELVEGRVLAA